MNVLNYSPLKDDTPKKHPQNFGVPKESEPLSMGREVGAEHSESEIQEVVEHTPQDEEVKEFIEVKKETPDIPSEVKQAGVETTSNPQFSGFQDIALPISDDKVLIGQTAPVTSSLRWLSALASFMLSQAHLTIKSVHGKATRVLKK